MKKIFLILIFLLPINVYALELPQLNSDKFIIYDLTTKEVLAENKSLEKTSIASLTKIMSIITGLEKINNLDESVTITKEMLNGVYWNASRAGLKIGDKITYKDLLYAGILPSGADAIHALAYSLNGDINSYVNDMNNLANKLNLENTNFSNVVGLDNINNYSTMHDVAKILEYALNNNTFKKIYTTREYILTNGLKVEATITSFNKQMNLDISRIIGSKTGYTNNAGYCLSSLINSHNHDIIIITGGAKKIENHFYHIIDTLNLINYTDNLLIEKEELKKAEAEAERLKEEQEKEEKLRQEKLIKIENNQIYVNKAIIVGVVFLFCLGLGLISKNIKK